MRSIVFGAAVRNNAASAFNYLLKLEQKTYDVHLKDDILGALTVTQRSEEAQTLLDRLKDVDKVRAQDVDHWLVYLLRNRHTRTQAWKWFRDNWGWIEKTFSHDQTYDNFPRYAASAFSTPKLLTEYKTFFEPKRTQPALTRNISIGIEEIENRIDWLQRDIKPVQKFFKT